MGFTDREQQLERLILAYREALFTTSGDGRSRADSSALQMSDLWAAGERAFKELERCFDVIAAERPVQLEHLRACYGLPPFSLPATRVTVKRRGPKWIGLKPNQRITASPLPDSWNRAGKPVTVPIEVIVETWPAWVRAEKVRLAVAALASAYRNGGEIYVPIEFVPVAA